MPQTSSGLITLFGAAALAAVAGCASTPSPAPKPAAAAPLPSPAQEDPYLWLEPFNSERSDAWVLEENKRTTDVLEQDRRFAANAADALAIAEASDRIPMGRLLNGAVYNFWQDAEHVRGIWRRTTLADYRNPAPAWVTVLDLDALATDEKANWVHHGAICREPDEKRCLIALSDGGEDAVTFREFDLASNTFVKDGFVLPRGKMSAAWEDADTLLVSREWEPGDLTASGYPYIVKRVRRGQPLSAAVEIYRGAREDGGYGVSPNALADANGGRALIIRRPLDTFTFEYHLVTPTGVKRLAFPLKSAPRDLVAGRLVVSLNESWTPQNGVVMPEGSLVALDLAQLTAQPDAPVPTLVYAPGPKESLQGAAATRTSLLVETLDNVRGRIWSYAPAANGTWTRVALPLLDNAALGVVSTTLASDDAFVSVSAFITPSTVVLADAATAKVTQVKALPAKFDASNLVVEQHEATSRDGTKVPYFVVHRRDIPLDGSNPTLLYAYGGFQASMKPRYDAVTGKLWLERGGIYALANIRGGGEFGPKWHEAGLKTRRQVVYDDFAAVGEDLIARKITSPRRLGIRGGSNGGLLMGVQLTQRPELWHAVVIDVPLLDMIRIGHIAAGSSWQGEYGDPDKDAEVRAFWERVSPYQNLRREQAYPEPFVFTTTKDDRVGPQHARKFAARLKEYGKPYYFYELVEGGHGAGANLKQQARTQALEMTYLQRKLMD